MHVGELDGIFGSCLWFGRALAVVVLWGVKLHIEDLRPLLCMCVPPPALCHSAFQIAIL